MYLTKLFFGKAINKLLADASLIDCILIINNCLQMFYKEYE